MLAKVSDRRCSVGELYPLVLLACILCVGALRRTENKYPTLSLNRRCIMHKHSVAYSEDCFHTNKDSSHEHESPEHPNVNERDIDACVACNRGQGCDDHKRISLVSSPQ